MGGRRCLDGIDCFNDAVKGGIGAHGHVGSNEVVVD